MALQRKSKLVKVFIYKSHRQWDDLDTNEIALRIFQKWYENINVNGRYRHIKHAFNSLCKHEKYIRIEQRAAKDTYIVTNTHNWKV